MADEANKPAVDEEVPEEAVETDEELAGDSAEDADTDERSGVLDRLEDEHRLSFLLQHDKRLIYLVVLALILVVSVFGYLIRSNSLDLVSVNQSLANLSKMVRDLSTSRQAEVQPTGEKVVREANPASFYCLENGGQLAIAKRPDGAEYGLCLFGPDRQCEEWAFQRGACPADGVDISQFTNPADVYCVVTGNEIAPSLIPGRSGKCIVDREECDAQAFYETGNCGN